MSSPKPPIRAYIDKQHPVGQGSYGTVYSASHEIHGRPSFVCKLIPLSRRHVSVVPLREIKYLNEASTLVYEATSDTLVPTRAFTGAPRVLDAFVDDGLDHVCILMERMSSRNLGRIVDHFKYVDLSELVYSWLVYSVYLLASLEHQGILHRDIKPDHLFMNDEGCFGLVDWGLSTKHADNQYLTQYMFTYLYRPPEVFYYGLPLYERQPSWKTIESYDRRHYIESARAPDVISPSIMYTKKNILNGPENPFPYSSESDVYSLGMSFITILLGQFPFKTNNRLSFHYREKLVMRKLFKWRKMVPQVDTSPELDDSVDDDDDLHSLSFYQVLQYHWNHSFYTKTPSVLCPFSSPEEASYYCNHSKSPLEVLLEKSIRYCRPSWVHSFLSSHGDILLSMCELDPDARPTPKSLLTLLSQGKPLDFWQNESKKFIGKLPSIRSYAFYTCTIVCSSPLYRVAFSSQEEFDMTQCLMEANRSKLSSLLEDLYPVSVTKDYRQRCLLTNQLIHHYLDD